MPFDCMASAERRESLHEQLRWVEAGDRSQLSRHHISKPDAAPWATRPCPPLIAAAKPTRVSYTSGSERPLHPVKQINQAQGNFPKDLNYASNTVQSKKKEGKKGNTGTELHRGLVHSIPQLAKILQQKS